MLHIYYKQKKILSNLPWSEKVLMDKIEAF